VTRSCRFTQHFVDRHLGERSRTSQSNSGRVGLLVDLDRVDRGDSFQRCTNPCGARGAAGLLDDELDFRQDV
jgi:hypothetical protein